MNLKSLRSEAGHFYLKMQLIRVRREVTVCPVNEEENLTKPQNFAIVS